MAATERFSPWGRKYINALAIHAGKGHQYLNGHELRKYPTGCVVAVAILRSCLDVDYARECFERGKLPYIGGKREGLTLADVKRILSHEHCEGPYAWVLEQIRAFQEPVPARGAQGLWIWSPPADWERRLVRVEG